jgi:hypothetical protein
MDLDLLRRVRRSSLIFGGFMMIPLATYFGIGPGLAWGAGIVWSLVNLRLIASVVTRALTLEERSVRGIVIAMLIKFPVLYAAGFGLLKLGLPVIWLVAGFTWPFFVVVLKGAGRAYMKMDEGELTESRSH